MGGDHDPRVPFTKETIKPKFFSDFRWVVIMTHVFHLLKKQSNQKFLFDFQVGVDYDPHLPFPKETV